MVKDARAKIAIIIVPDVMPDDDSTRVIGRRTRCVGTEQSSFRARVVVVVAVLKDALRTEDHGYLTTDDQVCAAGGVGPSRPRRGWPWIPEE